MAVHTTDWHKEQDTNLDESIGFAIRPIRSGWPGQGWEATQKLPFILCS